MADEGVQKYLEQAELFAREPWRGVLWWAAEDIERNGLHKGAYCDAATGAYCTLGAMGWKGESIISRLRYEAADIFAEYIGARIADNIPGWNDAPERTQAEVVAKLREVALSGK